jgi:hypothetical protein
MLRKIFAPKRNEVTEEWRRLHNEERYSLLLTKFYLGNQIKKNGMGRTCSVYGGRGGVRRGFWWENLREEDHLETQVYVGG